MKRFPKGVSKFILLSLLQLSLLASSSVPTGSRARPGAKPAREVQFSDREEGRRRTNSNASDKTDIGDKEDSGGLDDSAISIVHQILSGNYCAEKHLHEDTFNAEASSRLNFEGFEGIAGGASRGSCYGGSSIIGSACTGDFLFDSYGLDGSGLTSTQSNPSGVGSEMTASKCLFYGSTSPASVLTKVKTRTVEGEFEEIIFDSEIGLETVKGDFDFDRRAFRSTPVEDCFQGSSVYSVQIDWVFKSFIPFLQAGRLLREETAMQILECAIHEFMQESAIFDVDVSDWEELYVVGDIHGQFDDLIRIFEQNGRPIGDKKFIFNGDLVDRGPNSLECLLTLFLLKITQPNNIFITRGNHESHTCGEGTFKSECLDKMSESFFAACHDVFNALPLGYIIKEKFFVCHGGIPASFSVEDLRRASKPNYTPSQQALAFELLWNDPHEGLGMVVSKRGGSTLAFGWDVTLDFLKTHGFSLLIRSHEYHRKGYFFCHNNLCLTVFSAPNYCGIGNKGSIIRIKSDLSYDLVTINTPDTQIDLSVSTYARREKERSMTINCEEIDFVFLDSLTDYGSEHPEVSSTDTKVPNEGK